MSSLYVPVMQAARTLLAYGARPGTVDFGGDTALKHALRHGDADMVTLLLRKEMSDLSDRYKAPLMGAVEEVRTSCMCSYCHVRHTWLALCFGIPAKAGDRAKCNGGFQTVSITCHVCTRWQLLLKPRA